MAFSTKHVGDDLLDGVNRAFRTVPELLDALMLALAERIHPVGGSLWLRGHGTVVVREVNGRPVSSWSSGSPPEAVGAVDRAVSATLWPPRAGGAALPGDASASLVHPIVYADSQLGELRLEMRAPLAPADPVRELLRHFARNCGLLVRRYDVRDWSERRLGRPLMLVGMSRPLREFEQFLEISARATLPVLLRGEFGTEMAQSAATLHCCGANPEGPFIQVDCAEPSGTPASWIEQAQGGSLFLGDIDELDPRLQKQLPQHLPSRLDRWLPTSGARQVRVIASTTADLHQRAREGLFSRSLLAELDFLSATVPPLRERLDDIEALVTHALERNGFRSDDKRTDTLVAFCRVHSWPENLFELQRVIARLAVMTEDRPIDRQGIRRHAPVLFANADASALLFPAANEAGDGSGSADHWVRCAIAGKGPMLRDLHPGLGRALAHLGAHYDEPIALDQLARHANVSPSHLGFLFRSAIGMPFKTLLGHIRIHKAQEILTTDARSNITEIALMVGFADLSHFEKSFRRIVGKSPRDFRRSVASERHREWQIAAEAPHRDPRPRRTALG
ncbi:MAG: helix-turn-helix domain-containing protein [Sphingomonas sp.]